MKYGNKNKLDKILMKLDLDLTLNLKAYDNIPEDGLKVWTEVIVKKSGNIIIKEDLEGVADDDMIGSYILSFIREEKLKNLLG